MASQFMKTDTGEKLDRKKYRNFNTELRYPFLINYSHFTEGNVKIGNSEILYPCAWQLAVNVMRFVLT